MNHCHSAPHYLWFNTFTGSITNRRTIPLMIRRRCQHNGLMANHPKHTQHDLNSRSTIHTMPWQCSSLSSLLCWREAVSHTTHTCPAFPLTSSSCLLVSSSILRMSSIVRSTHLSSQQKSCRWKFVKRRFSCCKRRNKTQTSLVTGQLPWSSQDCNNFQRCVRWRIGSLAHLSI